MRGNEGTGRMAMSVPRIEPSFSLGRQSRVGALATILSLSPWPGGYLVGREGKTKGQVKSR
jgi:hypothetical protein